MYPGSILRSIHTYTWAPPRASCVYTPGLYLALHVHIHLGSFSFLCIMHTHNWAWAPSCASCAYSWAPLNASCTHIPGLHLVLHLHMFASRFCICECLWADLAGERLFFGHLAALQWQLNRRDQEFGLRSRVSMVGGTKLTGCLGVSFWTHLLPCSGSGAKGIRGPWQERGEHPGWHKAAKGKDHRVAWGFFLDSLLPCSDGGAIMIKT
eukprot:1142496-Pelagomonas_calceolata.AAC.6